eukprot:TCALIF_09897-PA protein Name:"Similar to wnt4a Protein Wnt-4a (Danio rerio)" AED:0.67 eAED:0.83 QI:0/0/0/1/1/1/2/0/218
MTRERERQLVRGFLNLSSPAKTAASDQNGITSHHGDFVSSYRALSKIGSVAMVDPPDQVCNEMKGSLIKKQIKFCKRHPMFMDSVRVGALRAMDECQYQFRSRRWNCSSFEDKMNTDFDAIKTNLESPNYQGGRYVEPTIMRGMSNHSRRGSSGSPSEYVYHQTTDARPSHSLPARPGLNSLMNAIYSNNNYGYGGNRRRDLNQRALRRGRRLSRKGE